MENINTKIPSVDARMTCVVTDEMDKNDNVPNGESLSNGNDDKRNCTDNKSKEPGKKRRISRHSSAVTPLPSPIITASSTEFLNAFSRSSAKRHPPHQQSLSSPTLKVLDALAKFQTCLFILSNTVVSLHDSLKLIIPRHRSSSSSSKMPTTAGFGRKVFYQSEISLHNNNFLKQDAPKLTVPTTTTQEKAESVTVSISSSCASTSLDTDSSDFSFVGEDCGDNMSTTKHPQQPSCCTKVVSKLTKYVGLFLALFASVCFSLVTLVVKFMEGYHPVSKVIWRLQGVLFPSLLIVLYVKYYKKKSLITWNTDDAIKHWKWKILALLVVRGVVGCSADIFQYYSLKYLPLADSTVISFSTPIFVCIVAHFVLGERWGVVPIVTAIVTLCGVVVIAKPPIFTGGEAMSNAKLWGNCLAVFCMISATITTIIMRFLKNVHFAVTMLALGVVGTLEGFLVTLFTSPFEFPHVLNLQDMALAGLTVGLFFFGQLAQTLALKYEEAGVVSLVRTCDVLFAFIWQVNLLHQKADISSYIGAAIVTSGVCITALRRWISDMPEHHPIRTRLFFLLR